MSAFLAVLLSVIMLFENTFLTMTRYDGARAVMDRLLDQCAYSVLADFDGRVKEQYGLYLLYQDGSSLKEKLSGYLSENLGYESERGFFPLTLQSVEVSENGFFHLSALEEQILDYCRYRIPLSTIEEFLTRADGFLTFLQAETPACFRISYLRY